MSTLPTQFWPPLAPDVAAVATARTCARGRAGAARRQHRPRGWAAASAPPGRHWARRHCRDQESFAVKGLIRADFDPAWLARRYRAGRRSGALRAHRRAVLPGQPAQPGAGLGRRAAALPAQGLHGRRVPDRRGPRPPRRRHSAHRRRAHRRRAASALPRRRTRCRSTCWSRCTPRTSWIAFSMRWAKPAPTPSA